MTFITNNSADGADVAVYRPGPLVILGVLTLGLPIAVLTKMAVENLHNRKYGE